MAKSQKVDKVVRRRDSNDDGNWTELAFERRGAQVKYTSPTLKASKHGISLYKTSFVGDQKIRIFKNGTKVGVVLDAHGVKKLKSNKSNTRVSIIGKRVPQELGLKSGTTLAGVKGVIAGKPAWIFG